MPKVLAVGGVRRIRAENGMLLPATIGVRSFFFKSRIFCDHGISVVVVVGCGSVFVLSDGSGGIGDVVKSLVEADVSNGCEGSDVSQLVAKMPAKSRDNTIKIEAIRRTECDLRREMFVFMYSLQLCRSSTATCKKTLFTTIFYHASVRMCLVQLCIRTSLFI